MRESSASPILGLDTELTTCSVRLANHIYAEHLMDRDHYMDWLLDSLEKSPQSKLPIWVLLLQIYWKDMLRLRRTARKLVTILLYHLHEVRCRGYSIIRGAKSNTNRVTTADPEPPRQGHSFTPILAPGLTTLGTDGPQSSELRLVRHVVQVSRYASCEYPARRCATSEDVQVDRRQKRAARRILQ
jgi:hypothetical protein